MNKLTLFTFIFFAISLVNAQNEKITQKLQNFSEVKAFDGLSVNLIKSTKNEAVITGVNTQKVGLGSDVMVPWFGKMGLNLYGTYDSNKKDWNGFQISTNWFKPFHFFENGSFISYQGYIDYQFGMDEDKGYATSSNGGAMFNGLYWHSDQFAVGYGLKLYKDVYGFADGEGLPWDPTTNAESSGVGHYVSVTYKF